MNGFGELRQAAPGCHLAIVRNLGVSLAFAMFGIVALVAPCFPLYMLSVPAPPAA